MRLASHLSPLPPPGGEGRVRGGTIFALALLLASSASARDLSAVAEYFELLAKAGVVSFR